MKNTLTGTGQEDVRQFLNNLDHPLKDEIEVLREIILGTNNELTEHIKWKAPSFCHNGEDRITFNLPPKKDSIQLVFHRGAKVKETKGDQKLIEDTTGLLKWASQDRAIVKFNSMGEVKTNKEGLVQVINQWIKAST